MTTSLNPRREIVAYLGVAYALALTVALALPNAHVNLLLSIAVPTTTVGILTFALIPKGKRRELWRGVGLRRAGFKAWPGGVAVPLGVGAGGGGGGAGAWPAAIAIPLVLAAGAYGVALAIGAGRLDVHLKNATPDWAINLAISLVIGTLFIIGEEIGWRGFLLPRFQQLTSKKRAAVVTG